MTDLTERSIQCGLYLSLRAGCRLVVPNFTPARWFECDLWAVTNAGYATEYEIKLTRSDFLADAAKRDRLGLKHDRVHAGDPAGPSRFYYVMPEGLVAPEDVPAWAGIKTARPARLRRYAMVDETRPAPKLHRYKAAERDVQRAARNFYFRYWDALITKGVA